MQKQMPFNAMQGNSPYVIVNISQKATGNISQKATGNIPYAPSGIRTQDSGFKDPRANRLH